MPWVHLPPARQGNLKTSATQDISLKEAWSRTEAASLKKKITKEGKRSCEGYQGKRNRETTQGPAHNNHEISRILQEILAMQVHIQQVAKMAQIKAENEPILKCI